MTDFYKQTENKGLDFLGCGISELELGKFVVGMRQKLFLNRCKGDNWKYCPSEFLVGKLLEETGEFLKDKNPEELLDIATVCLMLYLRSDL